MFDHMATEVHDIVRVECEFVLPELEEGELIDPEHLYVLYTEGSSNGEQQFVKVADALECGKPLDDGAEGAFYLDDNTVRLCQSACDLVVADDEAHIEISAGCAIDLN